MSNSQQPTNAESASNAGKLLSFVIPVLNEQPTLAELLKEIDTVVSANGYEVEVIFVDDGSTDASWDEIRRLTTIDGRVQGIRFRRNFGKAAALSAGFAASRGDIIFTLDGDLQDDPAEIPRFLQALSNETNELDVVSGWKKVRHDPWHKVIPSRFFNAIVGWLTGVKLHDHNCGFKCYRREIFDEVRLYGELHRFVPVLAAARGWRVGEIDVNHRPRMQGVSKYGFGRFLRGFLDLLTVYFLTGFNQRPQHLLGSIGIVSFLVGLIGLVYFAVYWVLTQTFPEWKWLPLHQRPAVLYCVGCLLLGAQFMSIGFLAELMTAYYMRDTRAYSIKEHIEPRSPLHTSTSEDELLAD